MSNVQKMSIALTPEIALVVQQAVETGEYASSSEVIREALREWKLKRSLLQANIKDMRRLWAEGIESGPGIIQSVATIKQKARQKLHKK